MLPELLNLWLKSTCRKFDGRHVKFAREARRCLLQNKHRSDTELTSNHNFRTVEITRRCMFCSLLIDETPLVLDCRNHANGLLSLLQHTRVCLEVNR